MTCFEGPVDLGWKKSCDLVSEKDKTKYAIVKSIPNQITSCKDENKAWNEENKYV